MNFSTNFNEGDEDERRIAAWQKFPCRLHRRGSIQFDAIHSESVRIPSQSEFVLSNDREAPLLPVMWSSVTGSIRSFFPFFTTLVAKFSGYHVKYVRRLYERKHSFGFFVLNQTFIDYYAAITCSVSFSEI